MKNLVNKWNSEITTIIVVYPCSRSISLNYLEVIMKLCSYHYDYLDCRYSNTGTPQTVLQILPDECQQYVVYYKVIV